MHTLAFLNQKGRCGKTTLAVHTAVAAQEDGELGIDRRAAVCGDRLDLAFEPAPCGQICRKIRSAGSLATHRRCRKACGNSVGLGLASR